MAAFNKEHIHCIPSALKKNAAEMICYSLGCDSRNLKKIALGKISEDFHLKVGQRPGQLQQFQDGTTTATSTA